MSSIVDNFDESLLKISNSMEEAELISSLIAFKEKGI